MFCDSNPLLQGRIISGVPVVSPQELRGMQFAGVVVASSEYGKDMIGTLKSMGIPDEKILLLYS